MAKTISDENIRLNIIINGNSAQKELLDLEKSTRQYTATNKDLAAAKAKLISEGKKESQEYKNLSAEIKANNVIIGQNKTKMEALQKEIGVTGLTMHQLTQKAKLLRLQLFNAIPGGEAAKKYGQELTEVNARIKELRGAAGTATNTFAKFKSGLASVGFPVSAAMLFTQAITGTINKIKELVTANIDLEEAQANVRKTTGYSKQQVDALTESLKKLNTKTPIDELLGLAEAGGRLNLTGKELEDFVKNTDIAFVALGDSLEGNAEDIGLILGKLAGNFDLDRKYGIGDAIGKIGSSLNELGANSKATEGPIVDFIQRLAGVSSQAGIAIPDLAALGALFDENGQSVEVATTTFNKLLPAIGKDVERFAKIAGINVKDFKKIVEEDAFEALKLVAKGAQSNEEGLVGLSKTLENYGVDSARAASIVGILSSKTDRLTELQKISNNAFEKGTSLAAEQALKNETLGATWDKIGNILLAKFTGSGVNDFLKGIAEGFLNIVKPTESVIDAAFRLEDEYNNLESSMNPLIRRYDELKGKTTLSTDEQVELNSIILQISKNIPGAITEFDKYGNALDISTTAAKAFIEQQKNLLYVKNKEAIEDAEDEIAKYKRILDQLPASYQKAADGSLLISKTIGAGKDAQTFFIKATNEQVQAYQERLKIINANIDGNKLLAASLKGEETEEQIAAKKSTATTGETPEEKAAREAKDAIAVEAAKKRAEENLKAREENLKKLAELEKKYESDKLNRLAVSNEDKAKLARDEAVNAATALGAKKELLDTIEAEHKIKIDEAKLKDEEIELKRLADFEAIKRELQNQIDIENASTQEIADNLKLTLDLEKQLADLELTKFNEEEKGELKKLIIEKYNKDIDKILEKSALDRLKKQKDIGITEINFEKEKASIKIALAQQLGGVLISILGDSLGAQLAAIAFNAIIEIAKLRIATSAAQQINLAQAVALGPILGPPAVAAATVQNIALGASSKLQQGAILAAAAISGLGAALKKKPKTESATATGFEDGLYPVTRQQDGKQFNAGFGGQTPSGMVNKPTVFMAGENGPELIIDSKAYKQINPEIKYALHREIARVKGFEGGYYQQQQQPTYSENAPINSQNDNLLMAALNRNSAILEKLDSTGVIAYMSNDLKNAKEIRDSINDYEKLRNKNKV